MLKDTLLKFFKLDGFMESLGGYMETRAELFKLEIKEEITKSLAKLSLLFILAFIFLTSIVFLSIALAFWIGECTNTIIGFAVVGLFYLLVASVLWIFREQLNNSLEKKFLNIIKHKKK